jgi:tetratricopeptide (TPR) repeat protein
VYSMKMDRQVLALANFEKALGIQLELLGPEHLEVARTYIATSNFYSSSGQSDLALANLDKALEIQLKILGPEHLEVSYTYFSMGLAYLRPVVDSNSSQMIALEEAGLMNSAASLGLNSTKSTENIEAAQVNFDKSMEIKRKILGGNHPQVSEAYEQIGNAYKNIGKSDLALANFEKALASLELWLQALGSDPPDTGKTYFSIGIMYVHKGRYDLAQENFDKSLAIKRAAFGNEHSEVLRAYEKIAIAYMENGQAELAIENYEKSSQTFMEMDYFRFLSYVMESSQ